MSDPHPQTCTSPAEAQRLLTPLHAPSFLSPSRSGLWRSPYTVESLGAVSVLIYFADLARPYVLGLVGVVGALYYTGAGRA